MAAAVDAVLADLGDTAERSLLESLVIEEQLEDYGYADLGEAGGQADAARMGGEPSGGTQPSQEQILLLMRHMLPQGQDPPAAWLLTAAEPADGFVIVEGAATGSTAQPEAAAQPTKEPKEGTAAWWYEHRFDPVLPGSDLSGGPRPQSFLCCGGGGGGGAVLTDGFGGSRCCLCVKHSTQCLGVLRPVCAVLTLRAAGGEAQRQRQRWRV